MKPTYSILDLAFQQAYRVAYFFLKLSWRVFKRDTKGAQVVLSVNGEILLVRSSYRKEFTFPGGYINSNETAEQAARRELAEEVNIDVCQSTMHLRKKVEYCEYGRHAVDYIFSCDINKKPSVYVNNREIVEAVFVSPVAALKLPLHMGTKQIIETVVNF